MKLKETLKKTKFSVLIDEKLVLVFDTNEHLKANAETICDKVLNTFETSKIPLKNIISFVPIAAI
ncbi:hypothetical protein TSAR_006819 [Trichomalopsis sarcophagae]|uniref:Uncharacterized protein n=1 Tax=Trichomalopsis sarcophagae TaxID=543379 RepID=A0A232F2B1_9HYME|nr:hypothetical protein TSAR_006819 [Trichomalopsis sarcophagae]